MFTSSKLVSRTSSLGASALRGVATLVNAGAVGANAAAVEAIARTVNAVNPFMMNIC